MEEAPIPTAAELSLILKFRDQATASARTAFNAVAQAGVQAARLPQRAFEAFHDTVNRVNQTIRFMRRFLFEVTLALSPFISALVIAGQNNTVVAEQFQRLSRTFRDVATQIGIRLLPVLTAFADWVDKNAPRIIKWFEELPRHIARALLQIGQMLAQIAQSISAKFPEAAEAIVDVVSGLRAGARAARDFGIGMKAAAVTANDAGNQIRSGIKLSLNEAYDSLKNFGALAREMTTGAIRGLQGSFETLFTTLITRSQSAKEAFRNFALGVLTMIAQMIAKLIATAILMTLLGFIPGVGPAVQAADVVSNSVRGIRIGNLQDAGGNQLTRHAGGLIPAYHTGGEVNALLEPGEFVMNRRSTTKNLAALQRMNAGGGGQPPVQNVFIINATDAASFRGRIQESADVIESIFQRAMRRNSGPMREAIRI